MYFKQLCSFGVSLLVIVPTIVSADTYETSILLNQESAIIDVEMPISLPISVDAKGVVSVSDSVSITNNSCGSIEIKGVTITPSNGWSLSSFDKDYSSERLGLKEFGFKVEGVEAYDSGVISLTDTQIEGGSSRSI